MAAKSFNARLPFPPSVNHYWHRRGARSFIGTAGKRFRAEVLETIKNPPRLLGRLRVLVELVMPDRRRRDVDNYQKAALDALTHAGVYEDDCQIDELIVRRLHVEPPGACDVTIVEVGE
jgi:crossover junction endodeoxyribonuclease RusA